MSNPVSKTFNDPRFSDCEIHVEEKVFKVNKLFLCAHSEVFDAFFKYDTKEKQTNVIKIDEAKSDIVEVMLKFMYSMEVENLDGIAKDLFVLADRYNVKDLMTKCTDYFYDNISLGTIFDCFSLVNSYDLPLLKNEVFNFALNNMYDIMKMKEWPEFSCQNYDLVQELMMRLAEEKQHSKNEKECEKKYSRPIRNIYEIDSASDSDFDPDLNDSISDISSLFEEEM